ncbi:glycosyltransferase [Thermus thermamylovorans]|uniref:Glycosyltransferase n=1 Tax=Thermus thermamylovorans TaxID=2509362 RepID=A0A4Q9B7V9_9DEIN|nr:glycosyltransferase [Thermus thermamylovorans]
MERPKNARLLKVVTGLAYGGAETQVVALAHRLHARGWAVQVASLLEPQAFVGELREAGIPVAVLGMRRGQPDPRGVVRLAALFRRYRPHVVHSQMIHANLLARVARVLAPVPVLISTAQNTLEVGRSFKTERSTHLAYRLTDFLADVTTQVSREGCERFLQGRAVRPDKLVYIPNGVDTERFAPRPEIRKVKRQELGVGEEFLWLAVGRLEEAKDYPTLLRAFAQVRGKHPQARLWVVGQGSLQDQVKSLALELRLGESVRFLGLRKDVPELMNAADAYVMSSAWEGMPMVLLEAHASGLPIVATDVGANREVVREGVSGFLVWPRSPEALAGAMERMLALDQGDRVLMGLRGREWVEEHFSLDKIVERWEALYLSLLKRKGLV